MFKINTDLSIEITRGDAVEFIVTAQENGKNYVFKTGDVVRFKVFEKKGCDCVVLQKDFGVESDTEEVTVVLEEADTKIGELIHKPKDYWYEVELNPDTLPYTIIGYDEDGAKVFKLYPEGRDLGADPITPEDIPFVDKELDITSHNPVENQAITKEFAKVNETIQENADATTQELGSKLSLSGGTMTGNLSMGGKKLTGLTDPVNDADAISLGYANRTYATKNHIHDVTAEQMGAVPINRTVNGKALSSNIVLSASDVGARPNTWMPTAEQVGAAPESHATNKNNPHGVTATQVGARPNTWMPTADDVGAMPNIKKSISNCSENDILEEGSYYVATANVSNVTDGASQLANYARWLHVFNFDTSETRVLQLEGRSASTTSGAYAGDVFYRILIKGGAQNPWKRIGDADYTVDTSVSGLTLVKCNGIVHAYSHTNYITLNGVAIPSGYRPKNVVYAQGSYINGSYVESPAMIKITTDGDISAGIDSSGFTKNDYWVRFTASWQV